MERGVRGFNGNFNQLDRFISNQSAMDFDYAHYMLTEGRKDKENPVVSSPSREAYRKQLAETFNMNRTRILAFKNKTSERTLDAPGLIDDYFLNFLDWGSSNVLAIALGNTVYLWDAIDGATFELEKCYTVLAIALGNTVYLWDATDGAISEQWFSY